MYEYEFFGQTSVCFLVEGNEQCNHPLHGKRASQYETGLKILWMNLILRTFTGINLNEKDKMEDSCENITKHHPQYFNFLRFIKLIIIYYMWIKIDQAFNSNISKASPSYSYNLFEQLISTFSN